MIAVFTADGGDGGDRLELGPVKDMKGANKALHLALVGATILSAWAFTHMMFALHYAAQYYVAEDDDDGVRGGFVFPHATSRAGASSATRLSSSAAPARRRTSISPRRAARDSA